MIGERREVPICNRDRTRAKKVYSSPLYDAYPGAYISCPPGKQGLKLGGPCVRRHLQWEEGHCDGDFALYLLSALFRGNGVPA